MPGKAVLASPSVEAEKTITKEDMNKANAILGGL